MGGHAAFVKTTAHHGRLVRLSLGGGGSFNPWLYPSKSEET